MLRSGSELWSRNVRVLSRGVVDRSALVTWTMHQSTIMEASERWTESSLVDFGGAQGFGWSRNNTWLILCLELIGKEDLVAYLCWNIDQVGVELLEFIYLSISFGFIALVSQRRGCIVAWEILQLYEQMADIPLFSPLFFPIGYFCKRSIWWGLLAFKINLSWILFCSFFRFTHPQ